jgi:dipeptidyl aminopeptidase/acylaminoacyl peptidase
MTRTALLRFPLAFAFPLVPVLALASAACAGHGMDGPPPWVAQREDGVAPAAPSASAAPKAAAPAAGYQGLGVASVPPEVLAKYAAPALPADASRRVQALLDVRAPGGGIVAPGGKRMFFPWSITGVNQVFRLDGPKTFPVQMTGGEDATSVLSVLPDGKTLILSRDRAGEENPGLYLQSADGGPLRTVQHIAGVQTFLDRVASDGKSFLFRSNDVTKDAYALYRWDIAAGKRELVFGEKGLWRVADEADDGRLLLEKSIGGDQEEIWEYTPSTKKLEPIAGQGLKEDHSAAYGAGGDIIIRTNAASEFRRLYVRKAGKDGAISSPITPELKHDVSGFSIDRKKQRILYTTNEQGYTRLHGLDAKTLRPLTIPKLPTHDHAHLGATSFDGRYTSIVVDPGTAPPQAWVVDWTGPSLTAWHQPAAPEVDLATFSRAELISYPARDGTKIPAFVRRPAGCKAGRGTPCPVIVTFHGGPEAQTMAGFSSRAQMFVDAGFIYLEPNVRGSDGFGKAWLHADDGAKRLAVLTDIEDAATFARKAYAEGGVAPKLGVFGGSYGGYSVLAAMTIYAGAYDCGVSVVGISNLKSFLANTAPYRRALRISEYGDPAKDDDALTKLSPFFHAEKLKAPLMLFQGATDPRVPVGEAIQFHDTLAARGQDVPLVIFPDEGHGAQKRPNQVLLYGHTLRFFAKHLGAKTGSEIK